MITSQLPPPRHVWLAEFVIGCFYYGAKTPFKTTVIKEDRQAQAMDKGRAELRPGTADSVRLIERRPNPEHLAYMKGRGF